MAYATTDFPAAGTGSRPGFLSRFFKAMVDARMRQAERIVAAHLLSFDEQTLKELGYDKHTLRRTSIGLAH